MLFLFNDVVFELGNLYELLQDGEIPLAQSEFQNLTPENLCDFVREGIFIDENIAKNKPDKIIYLCALIAFRSPGANALLALANPGAQGPQDVGIRFANVPITTLSFLWKQQKEGVLTAQDINGEVWEQVMGSLRKVY
jgi:hypothetical protein